MLLPHIYERVQAHVTPIEWAAYGGDVAAILDLKRKLNAIVLAHNYQAPEVFHTVADIVGDSLALAHAAANTDAEVIVMAGVRFMAETAKLLNPGKVVLIPDEGAGCSLADSITPADIVLLRERYPDIPIVAYVNTSAEVKALVDICCTSGNAVEVIRSLDVPRVIMLPDEYLARNTQKLMPGVEVIAWHGHCEVHERFTPEDLEELRQSYPGVEILAHPECPPEVAEAADFVGSTAGMTEYVDRQRPRRVALVTECSMSDNVAVNHPDIEFVRPCNLCPHMRRISLANIRWALEARQHEITIRPEIAVPARRAVERMLAIQ